MTGSGKTVAAAVLALALAATPAPAPEPERATREDVVKQLEEFNRQLRTLREEVGGLRQELRKEVGDLRQELLTTTTSAQKSRSDLRDLEERLRSLESLVRSQPDLVTARRYSLTPEAPLTGTIRLQNRSGTGATVLVNGLAHFLAPFETRVLAGQPAGSFTYEVLADGFGTIRPRVVRDLRPNEVFTIHVNP